MQYEKDDKEAIRDIPPESPPQAARRLVVSNHLGSSLAVLPIGEDGALGEVSQLATLDGPPGPQLWRTAGQQRQIDNKGPGALASRDMIAAVSAPFGAHNVSARRCTRATAGIWEWY